MSPASDAGRLADISVERIRPNPENPRLTFRQGELEELQESIRQFGVQVPIAVFRRGSDYVLIDGERRWRCASKLNLKTIPALIQPEPRPLENLLLMFNIHALREQWDLLTIALKLPSVIQLLTEEVGRAPTEREISRSTGLTRSVIRRSRLLMDLPVRYRNLLLSELKKPKSKQTISEDLFIEMERSLKTLERAIPELVPDKSGARDVLLTKYRQNIIENVVDFRKIAKIASSIKLGLPPASAKKAIKRLFSDPNYSIDDAYNASAADIYTEKDVLSRIDLLLARLSVLEAADLEHEVRRKLRELIRTAQSLLKTGR